MDSLYITIKDSTKTGFIIELLEKLDFVEINRKKRDKRKNSKHDILNSAGIWKDRNISAEELRKEAWNISNT